MIGNTRDIHSLIPTGCTVVTYDAMATVHDDGGEILFIACGGGAEAELRARLVAAIPDMLRSAGCALDNGKLIPLALGMDALNSAVYPPTILPAVGG